MDIFSKLEKSEIPQSIALGFFDGLHLGHRDVIKNALEFEGKVAVLTFKDHPNKFLKNKNVRKLITNEQKLSLFEKTGVDAVYMLDFPDVASFEANLFLEKVLKETLMAKQLSCGYNYRFGKMGKGDISLLDSFCIASGIKLNISSEVLYNGQEISSTKIRELLENGEVALANKMLGRNFGFEFKVVHGRKIGSTLGFPTINQIIPDDFIQPKFGVYVSETVIGLKHYRSITNIGVKPTVQSDYCLAETHIFDFKQDLYGKDLELELLSFLREEKKFDSLDELRKTIAADCIKARSFIK